MSFQLARRPPRQHAEEEKKLAQKLARLLGLPHPETFNNLEEVSQAIASEYPVAFGYLMLRRVRSFTGLLKMLPLLDATWRELEKFWGVAPYLIVRLSLPGGLYVYGYDLAQTDEAEPWKLVYQRGNGRCLMPFAALAAMLQPRKEGRSEEEER